MKNGNGNNISKKLKLREREKKSKRRLLYQWFNVTNVALWLIIDILFAFVSHSAKFSSENVISRRYDLCGVSVHIKYVPNKQYVRLLVAQRSPHWLNSQNFIFIFSSLNCVCVHLFVCLFFSSSFWWQCDNYADEWFTCSICQQTFIAWINSQSCLCGIFALLSRTEWYSVSW